MKKICLAFMLLSLVFPAEKGFPHPHVFIYTSVDIVFDKKGLAGFTIYWKFDEMFSSVFINDFDRNQNRKFEPAELKALEKGAFRNLRKSNYFCHVKIEKRRFPVEYVTDFTAWINGPHLHYSFHVPCHVTGYDKEKTVKLSVYDPTFYCSIFLTEEPVALKKEENFDIRYSTARNREEAYYYNQIYPEEITLTFKKSNE